MISFELKGNAFDKPGEELEVFLDRQGLESLIAQLRMLSSGSTDHVHLMSRSWGGAHLEDVPRAAANKAVHHVKISMT